MSEAGSMDISKGGPGSSVDGKKSTSRLHNLIGAPVETSDEAVMASSLMLQSYCQLSKAYHGLYSLQISPVRHIELEQTSPVLRGHPPSRNACDINGFRCLAMLIPDVDVVDFDEKIMCFYNAYFTVPISRLIDSSLFGRCSWLAVAC